MEFTPITIGVGYSFYGINILAIDSNKYGRRALLGCGKIIDTNEYFIDILFIHKRFK